MATVGTSDLFFRALVDGAREPVLVVDADTTIQFCAAGFERTFGYRERGMLGTRFDALVHAEDISRVRDAFASAGSLDVPCRIQHADGSWREVDIEVADRRGLSAVQAFAVTVRDVSQRRLADEALIHKALHDALTGLPNRALLLDRLGQALGRAGRNLRQVAVFFLDLDNFKVVNDSMGHEAGDLLLVETGHRLLSCVRSGDTVARFGGDEFAVLLEDVVSAEEAEATASRIADALRQPIDLGGHELSTDVSIGVALSSGRHTRPEDLLREADLAMYHAKAGGKGQHVLFHQTMQIRANARLEMEVGLRRAIERGELRLHYQPIVTLSDSRLVGFEALVRWQHPTRGLLLPSEFVPVAEETGLIVPIGQWVLETACHQLREWQITMPGATGLFVAVNVSARQLRHPGLVADFARALRQTGVDATGVTLEVTESVLVDDAESTTAVLHRLKALGVQIAIDDFGTGYSSLGYLSRLPVDRLKIDRSFVKGLGEYGQDHAIVRGIIELAGSLDLSTVAEGIENDVQLARLQELGSANGQGFLFARPLSPEDVTPLLFDNEPLAA